MPKTFVFPADVVNGEIQERPVDFTFECDRVIPIGPVTYKDYDSGVNYIIAKKGWMIQYGNQFFISTLFQTQQSYEQYVGIACQCCPCTECFALINHCYIQINGCDMQMCGCSQYEPLINGCGILINGCQFILN